MEKIGLSSPFKELQGPPGLLLEIAAEEMALLNC
jgi:hypothetical protein